MLGSIVALALMLGLMVALHERHYRTRRELIALARANGSGQLENLEERLIVLEGILSEDRFT